MTATTSPAIAPRVRNPRAARTRLDPGNVRVAAFFRNHHDARIDSELVWSTEEIVLFRASIVLPGAGSVTAHGSARWSEERHAVERAESRAVARAVAMIDSAAARSDRPGMVPNPAAAPEVRLQARQSQAPASAPRITTLRQPATNRQLKFIAALVKQLGLSDDMIEAEVASRFGMQALIDLERTQASELIDTFQQRLRSLDVAS